MQSDSLASPSAKSWSRETASVFPLIRSCWRKTFLPLRQAGAHRCPPGPRGTRGGSRGNSPGSARDAPCGPGPAPDRGRDGPGRHRNGEFPSTAIVLPSTRGLPHPGAAGGDPGAPLGQGRGRDSVPSVRAARASPSGEGAQPGMPPAPRTAPARVGPRPGSALRGCGPGPSASPVPPVPPHRRASPPRGRSVTGPPPRSRLPETQPDTAAGGSQRRHLPGRMPPRHPSAPPGTPPAPGGGGSAGAALPPAPPPGPQRPPPAAPGAHRGSARPSPRRARPKGGRAGVAAPRQRRTPGAGSPRPWPTFRLACHPTAHH